MPSLRMWCAQWLRPLSDRMTTYAEALVSLRRVSGHGYPTNRPQQRSNTYLSNTYWTDGDPTLDGGPPSGLNRNGCAYPEPTECRRIHLK